LPPAVLGKIFEPFFTTKEVGKGTGLGLSTVYGIVKQSGGFIFADSKVGEGTRFVIYLPVHQVEPETGKAVEQAQGEELWGSGTVLLVEDEPMVRTVAERALTRHGYTVITADQWRGGARTARQRRGDRPDDQRRGDAGDGRPDDRPRGAQVDPDLPILFMSGYAEEQLRKSIDLDKVAFLPKPFSVQELAEAARRAIEAKQRP
jgi:two-component system, cell cycle sensor histidine kinase and response regulator CckA